MNSSPSLISLWNEFSCGLGFNPESIRQKIRLFFLIISDSGLKWLHKSQKKYYYRRKSVIDKLSQKFELLDETACIKFINELEQKRVIESKTINWIGDGHLDWIDSIE